MARQGLMDDTGYDPMPYEDSFLEEVKDKGYVSGYQDGVVEACGLFVVKYLEILNYTGGYGLGRDVIEKIENAVVAELHESILKE